MAISDDILIDYTNRRIYQDHAYVEGTDTSYSVNALYSYIQDTFDELAQMDDPVPMSAQTPNAYTMINGWFIDDETTKWFIDGAVQTVGWTHPTSPTGIRLLTLDAVAGLSAADIGKVVEGIVTNDTGILLAYDTNRKTLWVRCDGADDLFDNATEGIEVDSTTCGDMAKASETGENLYVNVYTLGTIVSGVDIYAVQNAEKISSWWGDGHIDVLIKVKEMGAEIDEGKITVFARQYPTAGDASLYDHFPIDLSAGGRQAVPLSTALDLNNTSSQATVEDYIDGTTYTITFGFAGPYSRDLGNGNGANDYDVEIDCDGAYVAEVYEACKYVTREGSATQLDGMDGEQYIYADSSYAPVKASPFGTFAGGVFFGARGIWIANCHASDAQSFQLIDSSGTTQTPPNTVGCQVISVESGDRVAMFMLSGSGQPIEKDTYNVDGAHGSSSTTLLMVEDIAGSWASQDPPQAGYLRVIKTDGSEVLAEYASWASKTFTLVGTLGIDVDSGDDAYVPVIDDEATGTSISNTLIQSQTIYVITRVRKKGILPFEIAGSIGSNGITVSAIRTVDGIVS